jgi:hypothetical protein
VGVVGDLFPPLKVTDDLGDALGLDQTISFLLHAEQLEGDTGVEVLDKPLRADNSE